MVPESRELLDKPDVATHCPATGKRLRLKDLFPVKFTRVQDDGGDKPVCAASALHMPHRPETRRCAPCGGGGGAAAASGHHRLLRKCWAPHIQAGQRKLLAEWGTTGADECTARRGLRTVQQHHLNHVDRPLHISCSRDRHKPVARQRPTRLLVHAVHLQKSSRTRSTQKKSSENIGMPTR